MFDLDKNDVGAANEAGFRFELKMPTGEGTGAFIKVRGEQSATVRQYQKKKYNEYTMKQTAAKRRGKEYELDIDEAEEMSVEACINRIIDWENIAEASKEVPFTEANAKRILSKHDWIKEQVMEESRQALNFRPS